MPDILWNENGKLTVREVDDEGNLIEASKPKPEPFGGKGDHDGNGKVGGAKPPKGRLTVTTRVAPDVDRTLIVNGKLTVVTGTAS